MALNRKAFLFPILGHKTSLNKFKVIKITQSIFLTTGTLS